MRVKQGIRALLFFVILAAGTLALFHTEAPNEPSAMAFKKIEIRQSNTWSRMYRAAAVATGLRKPTMTDQLRDVMSGDELAEVNPFHNLSADDSFKEIFKMKVTAFERRTLRSPSYHDEAGYDLVHYEILHEDSQISSVLAYVETENNQAGNGVPELKRDVVVLLVITPKGEKNQYAVYRDGKLEEVRLILPEEGAALLAQHLDAGIPFLSVSR